MSQLLSNPEQSDADQLDATAADHVISTCGGDAREAVRALIVANHFLETELEKLRAAGLHWLCARENLVPHDREDWYD